MVTVESGVARDVGLGVREHVGDEEHFRLFTDKTDDYALGRLRVHLKQEHGLLYGSFPEGTRANLAADTAALAEAMADLDEFHRELHTDTAEPDADAEPAADWFDAEGYTAEESESPVEMAFVPSPTAFAPAEGVSWPAVVKAAPGPHRTVTFANRLTYTEFPTMTALQVDIEYMLTEFFGTLTSRSVEVDVVWVEEERMWAVDIHASAIW